jgi:hypothetical protein
MIHRGDRPPKGWEKTHVCNQHKPSDLRDFGFIHIGAVGQPDLAELSKAQEEARRAKTVAMVQTNMSFLAAASAAKFQEEKAYVQLGIVAARNGQTAEQVLVRDDRHSLSRRVDDMGLSLVGSMLAPYRECSGLSNICSISIDAVKIKRTSFLVGSIANALVSQLTGVTPFPLMIIRFFRGNREGYAQGVAAMVAAAVEEGFQVWGWVMDNLPVQVSVICWQSPHFCFANDQAMSGASAGGCGAHTEQLAVGDARREDPRLDRCFRVLDQVTQHLGSPFMMSIVGVRCPRAVQERWQACGTVTKHLLQHAPNILERVRIAIEDGLDPRLFHLDVLLPALGTEIHRYNIVVGPIADAVTNLEGDGVTCGDVLPTVLAAIDNMLHNVEELAQIAGFDQGSLWDSCNTLANCLMNRLSAGWFAPTRMLGAICTPRGRQIWRQAALDNETHRWRLEEEGISDNLPSRYAQSSTREKALRLMCQNTSEIDVLIEQIYEAAGLDPTLPSSDVASDDDYESDVVNVEESSAVSDVEFHSPNEGEYSAHLSEVSLDGPPIEVNENSDLSDGPPMDIDQYYSDSPSYDRDDPDDVDMDEDLEADIHDAGEGKTPLDFAVDCVAWYDVGLEETQRIVSGMNNRPDSMRLSPEMVEAGFTLWMMGPLPADILQLMRQGECARIWQAIVDSPSVMPALKAFGQVAIRVLAIPASEAHSERAVGRLRQILGDHRHRTGTATLLNILRMRMCTPDSPY